MDRSQTLREVFDRLAAGEPATVPADLEPGLVSHALRDYADTAPIEVAEHLEPFTSTVGGADAIAPDAGLDLLATAPAPPVEELAPAEGAAVDPVNSAVGLDEGTDEGMDVGMDFGMDFGSGLSGDVPDDADAGPADDLADGATGEQAGDLADEISDDPGLGAQPDEPWWTDLLGDATDAADAADAPDGGPGDLEA